MKYAFLIGRKPELSIAELQALFPKTNFTKSHNEFVFAELESPFTNLQSLLNQLGGTIKIVELIEEIDVEEVEETVARVLKNFFQGKETKCVFGVSSFGISGAKDFQKKLLLSLKKKLKTNGLKVRFVNKFFQNVAPIAVLKEDLTTEGMEINLFAMNKKILIGKTIAIQDVDAYGKRDYGKPFRDPRAGMLPPKLAQIMINLACGPSKNATIYDPFCGTGTILIEALLMGYSVIGSDSDAHMIEGTKQNLEWLKKDFSLFQKDVLQLTRADFNILPSVIVTEPYLGPPLEKFPGEEKVKVIANDLADFYVRAIQNLKNCLPTIPLVIAFPFWKAGNDIFFIENLIERIESLGYSRFVLGPDPSQRGTLIYDRPDQIVGREITKFIPE